MNVPDTRRIIFSYLRKEPKLKCDSCQNVLIWDKKIVRPYYVRSLEKNYFASYCKSCYIKNNYPISSLVYLFVFLILGYFLF